MSKKTDTPKPALTTLLIKKFDPELRTAMKIEALRSGKTLHDWVVQALRDAVQRAAAGS